MCKLVERAISLGAELPQDHLFPFRIKTNRYDVTRPASKSWIRKQWEQLRAAAGFPWLTLHCLRFQCATKMVAAGVPLPTIKKQFGWKNLKMLEHYNRPQLDILYEAVQRIDPTTSKRPITNVARTWMPRSPEQQATGD